MMGTYGMDMLNRTGADRRETPTTCPRPVRFNQNSLKGYTDGASKGGADYGARRSLMRRQVQNSPTNQLRPRRAPLASRAPNLNRVAMKGDRSMMEPIRGALRGFIISIENRAPRSQLRGAWLCYRDPTRTVQTVTTAIAKGQRGTSNSSMLFGARRFHLEVLCRGVRQRVFVTILGPAQVVMPCVDQAVL
jgi:hypothetical protein